MHRVSPGAAVSPFSVRFDVSRHSSFLSFSVCLFPCFFLSLLHCFLMCSSTSRLLVSLQVGNLEERAED